MHQYVKAPFERIAIDNDGLFPTSERGNRYLLVAMDYFTKWPEVYALIRRHQRWLPTYFVGSGSIGNSIVIKAGISSAD